MKFDELDKKMRVFETAFDQWVLPEIYIVARIDGRNFTRLTKETCKFNSPFDERFRDLMIETTKHLMQCGFNVIYGYTESDEISLLFHLQESAFGRKIRKYNSILSAEASAKFSLMLGILATFDCRICQLPTINLVCDYFRWRNEDAHRNALNAYCYWTLRQEGKTVGEATRAIEKISVAEKNELLFQRGINFNDVEAWQKRGVGIFWKSVEKQAKNPINNQEVAAKRRELYTEFNLPMKDDYTNFISSLIDLSTKI